MGGGYRLTKVNFVHVCPQIPMLLILNNRYQGLSVMWVPKLLYTPIKIRIFLPINGQILPPHYLYFFCVVIELVFQSFCQNIEHEFETQYQQQ